MKDKIQGCLVGLAVGDALGMPSSMMTPTQIAKTYGRIEDYVDPARNHLIHEELSAGEGTDDTAMALQVIDEMIENHGEIRISGIANKLKAWAKETDILKSPIIGPSTKSSLKGLLQGENPKTTGKNGTTNGAAMKCAPLGLMHSDIEQLKTNVYNAALPSHNTSVAMAGALTIASAVSAAFYHTDLDKVVEAAITGAEQGARMGTEVPAPSIAKRIKLARQIASDFEDPYEGAKELYELIGASMATSESVPTAIGYILLAKGDPFIAIKIAINTGDDADTIAAMVGAIGGAFKGIKAFPNGWLDAQKVSQLSDFYNRAEAIENLLQQ